MDITNVSFNSYLGNKILIKKQLKRFYLRIGSLLCEINAETSTYAEMLAETYSTNLIDRNPKDECDDEVELKLFIAETLSTQSSTISDTLTVTSTKEGYIIETDPISCSLVIETTATEN